MIPSKGNFVTLRTDSMDAASYENVKLRIFEVIGTTRSYKNMHMYLECQLVYPQQETWLKRVYVDLEDSQYSDIHCCCETLEEVFAENLELIL